MTLRLNKIEEKVKIYLRQKRLLESEMHVCVCFSGGADSTVLLWMLHRFREEFGIRLSACHFNHMIRGREADADERFCVQTCKSLGIPLYRGCADVPELQKQSKRSMEETARDVRYAWFCEIAEKYGIDRMATAHHQDDQTETVLFRMIRGTTVSGLAGIPSARDIFIRPLLCLTKDEILFYANGSSLNYQTDETNFSEQYTRNYIRQTVVPSLKKINPSVSNAIVRLAEYASEDDAYILSMLPECAEVQNLRGLSPSIIRRVISRNASVYTDQTICYQHVDEILHAILHGENKHIVLPNGFTAVVKNGSLFFQKESCEPLPVVESGVLREGITYCCNGLVRILFCKNQPSEISRCFSLFDDKNEIVYNLSTEILLSFEEICGMIRYGSRQSGDRLCLHGVNRSVKKLFSEKNIPVHLRQMIPVFSDDNGIIYIPHVAISDRVYTNKRQATHYMRVDLIDKFCRKVVEEL